MLKYTIYHVIFKLLTVIGPSSHFLRGITPELAWENGEGLELGLIWLGIIRQDVPHTDMQTHGHTHIHIHARIVNIQTEFIPGFGLMGAK